MRGKTILKKVSDILRSMRNRFMLLVIILVALPSLSFASWSIETVDGGSVKKISNVSSRPIVLDSSDNPHIVYGGDHLYHAWHDGTIWQYETVDASPGVGEYASLGIDSADKLHISYYDRTHYNLKYATNATGLWVSQTIDTTKYSGAHTSIAIDSSDKVHISYRGNNVIQYATNATGSWVIETVNLGGTFGTSIAVDSTGKVHISFSQLSTNNIQIDVKYVTNSSGSWVTQIVESPASSPSIVIDLSDNVHITYSSAGLKYATNKGVAPGVGSCPGNPDWDCEMIDSTSYGQTSIAIDSSDELHIGSGNLYATNRGVISGAGNCTDNADWDCETIAAVRGIAVDSLYNVHTTYGDLMYTTNATGSWETQTIDSSYESGEYTAIATDLSGNVHIAYYDRTGRAVMYATKAGGVWVTTIIDAVGSLPYNATMGEHVPIAITVDLLDNVHISYRVQSRGLRYATNRGVTPGTGNCIDASWKCEGIGSNYLSLSLATDLSGNVHIANDGQYVTNRGVTPGLGSCPNPDWDCETIDNSGRYPSVAIDFSGNVHISYISNNRDLKYITKKGVTPGAGNCPTNPDWDCDVVESPLPEPGSRSRTSLAIDSSDNIHISFIGYDSDLYHADLKYATNTSGSWMTQSIESIMIRLTYPSIAIDSSDNVHIVYYEWHKEEFMYATNAGGPWIIQIADTSGGSGAYPSIAIDSTDKIHVSYHDESNGTLKYASYIPGTGTYPNIVSVAPADQDDGVSIDTSVVVVFDKSMDTNAYFHLHAQYGDHGDGVYSWSNTGGNHNDTLTFIPDTPLKPGIIHSVEMNGYHTRDATGIHCLGGGCIDFRSSFQTAVAPGDVTPPTVMTLTPYDGESGVTHLRRTVRILFSEGMDQTSFTGGINVTLEGPNIGPSDYSVQYDFDGGINEKIPALKINLNKNLNPATTYTITIGPSVADISGNQMGTTFTSTYTTGPADMTPPLVSQTVPAVGDTNVSIYWPLITINFSEGVRKSTLNTTNITLQNLSDLSYVPLFVRTKEHNIGNRSFVQLAPALGITTLDYNTTYRVSISGVKNKEGNTIIPVSGDITTMANALTDADPVLLSFYAEGVTGSSYVELCVEVLEWDRYSEVPLNVTTTLPKSWTLLQEFPGAIEYCYESAVDEGLAPGIHNVDINVTDAGANTISYSSPVRIFPDVPSLTSPADGASGVSITPTLAWDLTGLIGPAKVSWAFVLDKPDSDPDAQDVWIGLKVVDDGKAYSLTIPNDQTLDYCTTYYWGVVAGDGYMQPKGYAMSAEYSFTTDCTGFNPFDADQNCIIGDFELLTAIDDWASGLLGDFELLHLIDYWAAGSYC